MRRLPLLAAALIAAAAPAAAAPAAPAAPEARLALALEGRVAGAPVDCLDMRLVRSARIIDGTAIVYDMGRTLYVNRPRAGADSLDRWDVMVSRPFAGRLCASDSVQMVEPGTRFPTGLVLLGEFVPYSRTR